MVVEADHVRAPASTTFRRRRRDGAARRDVGQGPVQEPMVGAVLLLALTRKPKLVVALPPTVPLSLALRTLIVPVVPVLTPSHMLASVCPPANINRTVQPLRTAEPLLVTVTLRWNPPSREHLRSR